MENQQIKMESEAVKKTENKKISSWHCDIYCRNVRHVTCKGKSGIDPDSPNACPYLDEMLY